MGSWLPLYAIAVGFLVCIVDFLLGKGTRTAAKAFWVWQGFYGSWSLRVTLLIGVVLVAAALTIERFRKIPGEWQSAFAFFLGVLAIVFADEAEVRMGRARKSLIPYALALFPSAIILLLPIHETQFWKAILYIPLGSGFAAALLAIGDKSHEANWGTITTFYSSLFAFSLLPAFAKDEEHEVPALLILLMAGLLSVSLANVFAEPFAKLFKFEPVPGASAVLFGLLFAVGSLLIGQYYVSDLVFTAVAVSGVIIAALSAWVLYEKGEAHSGLIGLAALLWIAGITVAFGLMKDYGITVMLLSAGMMYANFPVKRTLLAFGIAVGILFYRVFMEIHSSDVEAIAIGQSTYSILGLLIGILLPIALLEWGANIRARFSNWALAVLALFTIVVLLAVISVMMLVMDERGTVGFIVGNALSPIVLLFKGTERITVLAITPALASSVILGLPLLQNYFGMEREDKIRLVAYFAAVALVLIIVAKWLTQIPKAKRMEKSS
ncbi:MAG TPA: hypothetical protein VNK96_06730 [Fimbriimonadales bacterium]|nr:hypothetical protein [Fimbriimonadales bacterium]